MSGYTPLFSSLTTGTLCGRWPDIGLWPIVLSLADRHGVVDCTQAFISGITGLHVDDVTACMARFCQPDPRSRSDASDGARLALLDDHRDWGWRVVNHGLYREKARLAAKTAREVEEGRNKERMQDRRSPPETAGHPPSKLQTQTTNIKQDRNVKADEANWFQAFKSAYPRRAGDYNWRGAERAASARVAEGHTAAEFIAGAERYAEFCRLTDKTGTEYVQQASRFLGPGKPFLESWHPPPTKGDLRLAKNLSAADEFMRRTEEAK